MSYRQAMKWARKHPKGTRQPVLMHTESGFWPSRAFLEERYFPYRAACEAADVEPMQCEAYYRATLRNGAMSYMELPEQVEYTRAGKRDNLLGEKQQ